VLALTLQTLCGFPISDVSTDCTWQCLLILARTFAFPATTELFNANRFPRKLCNHATSNTDDDHMVIDGSLSPRVHCPYFLFPDETPDPVLDPEPTDGVTVESGAVVV
jgi:hypothetical protein